MEGNESFYKGDDYSTISGIEDIKKGMSPEALKKFEELMQKISKNGDEAVERAIEMLVGKKAEAADEAKEIDTSKDEKLQVKEVAAYNKKMEPNGMAPYPLPNKDKGEIKIDEWVNTQVLGTLKSVSEGSAQPPLLPPAAGSGLNPPPIR